MATYAVGDIQGCLPQLKRLLSQASFGPEDILWAAGDLVNRGPQSLESLRFFYELGDRTKIVLGNHDLHLLACWKGTRKPNKKDTFDEILNAKDADKLLNWLIQQPLIHRDKALGYAMVHAGIPPQWSLDFAEARAREVEATLKSSDPTSYFENMYGNTPTAWSNTLVGMTRMRVITNYFTRMRFINRNGELEFASKGGPEDPPEGYLPWYSYPRQTGKEEENERILFGHWAAMLGQTNNANFIGLDTGCVWGGSLTMLRLEDGKRYTQDCSGC